MSGVGSDYVLKNSDIPYLVQCLSSISDKWEELGIALHLLGSTKEQCRSNKNILSLERVLTEWVAGQGSKPVTLGQLVKALASAIVGRGQIAGTLISEFNKGLTEEAQPSYPAGGQACDPKASPGKSLCDKDLSEVFKVISPGARVKWKFIGLELGVDYGALQVIQTNHPGDVNDCCLDMLYQWLKGTTEKTWKKLADALQSDAVGFKDLAEEVKKRS